MNLISFVMQTNKRSRFINLVEIEQGDVSLNERMETNPDMPVPEGAQIDIKIGGGFKLHFHVINGKMVEYKPKIDLGN